MKYVLISVLAAMISATPSFAIKVGEAAPTLPVQDMNGKMTSVADFKGKYIVLEWHNQGCPYVKKHYNSGNMQKLQGQAKDLGVVWLTVISSKPGKQGAVTADEEKAYLTQQKASPTDVLLDQKSSFAEKYGAKTTPHMMVIDPQGNVIYTGAIDDKESTDVADVPTAKNYVMAALKESMAGKPVTVSSTRPYGCNVKY
jgi:peroxiredoxin